jgi:hypothetical protein
MDHSGWNPGRQVIYCAFEIAAETDQPCRPVHVLAALTEYEGPISAALVSPLGRPLFARPAHPRSVHGGHAGFLVVQTQEGAAHLASKRGETVGPEHLLLAVVDQGDPEVLDALNQAGLNLAAVRRVALEALGVPGDLPPISMPPLTPAGTIDRPPLLIDDLNPQAWSALCWRQDHLPLQEIKRQEHYFSLHRLESRAAWRVASKLQLDNDQRYSLLCHHLDQVERLAARARPEVVELRTAEPGFPSTTITVRHRRRLSRNGWFRFTVGWGTWIGNRRVGIRNRWFQFRTQRYFRHAPQL